VRLALFPTLALCFASLPASAGVVARIDNATQRMTVLVDGRPTYSWPVSTARKGYQTPAGHYRVQRMERMWHSRKYHMSPMPHAMFFRGGYAIHGTYSVGQLGRLIGHRRMVPVRRRQPALRRDHLVATGSLGFHPGVVGRWKAARTHR